MSSTSAPAGCVVCRSRKVRCDRSKPSCQNCQRLGVQCPGYHDELQAIPRSQLLKLAEDIYAASGVERRRFGSCEACRVAKERCTRTRPACRRCSLRGLQCVYRSSTHESRRMRPDQATSSPATSNATSEERDIDMRQRLISGPEIGSTQQTPKTTDTLRELFSDQLPEGALRTRLVHTFFERVHPLRCSSFIHKPSFLFSLDHGTVLDDYGEPLLHAMCALAARVMQKDEFHASKSLNGSCDAGLYSAGHAWAETARKSIMHEIHKPTLQHAMTLLLLCDYTLDTEQNALAYILAGCAFRAIRLLGLDIRKQPQNTVEHETGLRLAWASFSTDALLASGVALNSSWQNHVPTVPLPSSHRDFLTSAPRSAHYLHIVQEPEVLSFTQNLDLPALTIVLIKLRSEVLRTIRDGQPLGCTIWDDISPFMKMVKQLDVYYSNLPGRFALTDLNIYVHKDEHTLGALFGIHFFYHAAVFDLTRIALPGFTFPLAAAFRDAPQAFRAQCQERCRFHANAVSDMVKTGFQHTPIAFDDPFCVHAVTEATKIQIIHSATVANDEASMSLAMEHVRTNIQLLRYMNMQKEENPYLRLLQPLCLLFGFRDIAAEMGNNEAPSSLSGSSIEPEVTGSADMHHLVSWAPFRKALAEIQSKHINTTSPISLSSEPNSALHPQPPIDSVSALNVAGQMMDASMEDYARAADEVGDYLTWSMSELVATDMVPPWMNFDWTDSMADSQ